MRRAGGQPDGRCAGAGCREGRVGARGGRRGLPRKTAVHEEEVDTRYSVCAVEQVNNLEAVFIKPRAAVPTTASRASKRQCTTARPQRTIESPKAPPHTPPPRVAKPFPNPVYFTPTPTPHSPAHLSPLASPPAALTLVDPRRNRVQDPDLQPAAPTRRAALPPAPTTPIAPDAARAPAGADALDGARAVAALARRPGRRGRPGGEQPQRRARQRRQRRQRRARCRRHVRQRRRSRARPPRGRARREQRGCWGLLRARRHRGRGGFRRRGGGGGVRGGVDKRRYCGGGEAVAWMLARGGMVGWVCGAEWSNRPRVAWHVYTVRLHRAILPRRQQRKLWLKCAGPAPPVRQAIARGQLQAARSNP